MQLYIGNKNYSSWSMRPWVLMKQFGIAFDEVMIRFDSFEGQSAFKRQITAVSPAGCVPVLVLESGLAVWDTMAIAETLAEQFPQHALWPREAGARARARSLCAEMHAGFAALRNHFPMNIEAALPDVGPRVLAEQPAARADVDRIVQMWTQQLAAAGGPFLFGDFGIADATYAPVCTRIRTYALPVPAAVASYIDRVLHTRGVAAWIEGGLVEHDFLPSEEPYRKHP
jgi:glutathione S-transferase